MNNTYLTISKGKTFSCQRKIKIVNPHKLKDLLLKWLVVLHETHMVEFIIIN